MVQPVNIFDLATKHADWLSVRQKAVAGNVANANTPGYKAVDVKPFNELLSTGASSSGVNMARTNTRHMSISGSMDNIPLLPVDEDEITASGNNVNLDHELTKGAEISQQMHLNRSVVKTFQQMYMNVLKTQ